MEVVCLLVVLKSLGEEVIVLLAQGLLHRCDVQRGSGLLGFQRVRFLLSLLHRQEGFSVNVT